MKFSDLKSSILRQFAEANGHKCVPYITGAPGGGKSACAREIANELAAIHNIPESRIIEFNPSLREPTDILGLPSLKGDHSEWLPPQEFFAIRAGEGPSILIVEELSDATMDMQNPLCRVLLDRHAGQLPLSEQLYIVATGNRTEDRSGANRLSTKLANRLRVLDFTENLDDWLDWASRNGVNPVLRAFIRFRPDLLSSFDPKRDRNPTPRSWEDVSRIPMDLSPDVLFEHVKGAAGEGAAAEYCGFVRIFNELPSIEGILKDPKNAPVPTSPDVLFATSAKLLSLTDKKNVAKIYDFVQRMPKDYEIAFIFEAERQFDWLCRTKVWQDFALRNASVLIG